MPKEMKGITGIYMISCKDNGKIYIGSAVDIKKRWWVHQSELKNNKHHSPRLQNAYNKYGEDSFEFSLLVETSEDNLLREEQFFIDNLEPEFNILKIAGNSLGYKHSEETKKKMRGRVFSDDHKAKLSKAFKGKVVPEELRERLKESCIGKGTKAIIQLDLNDKFIKEWDSSTQASKTLKISRTAITNCLNGRSKQCNNFKWKYKNE